MKRGKSERYLKDERALEDYLVDEGSRTPCSSLATGEARAGADLRDIVETARASIAGILEGLHSRYPRFVIEQAAIAGALDAEAC